MGRDWYWGGGEKERPGCMTGMLHFLDFHHLLFSGTGSSALPPDSSPQVGYASPQQKGVEAPRNSLELDETAASTSAIGEFFDVPVGIQVVSSGKKKLSSLLEEEKRSSQAGSPRTPNVVARLMGLEVLPDLESSPPIHRQSSPCRFPLLPVVTTQERYLKKQQQQCTDDCRRALPPQRQPLQPRNCNVLLQSIDGGSRSVPDTPRASYAYPRLSMQLNKENNYKAMREFTCLYDVYAECSLPPSTSPHNTGNKDTLGHKNENKKPRSHYSAHELVKQVKESISNRRGSSDSGCGDDHAVRSRRSTRPAAKKASPYHGTLSEIVPLEVKPRPPTCSPPRIRFLEPPHHPLPNKDLQPALPAPKPKDQDEAKVIKMAASPCKKASYVRFTERIKKNKASPPDAVARSDSNKSSPVHSFAAVKPNHASQSEQESMIGTGVTQRLCQQPLEGDPEFRYVRSILKYAGILTAGVQAARWDSLSLPLGPVIFQQLELESISCTDEEELGPLRHRWNRKLLLHLVEELLGDLISTTDAHLAGNRKRWCGRGDALLLRLWSQIRSYPAADCRVVGDIDSLAEADLPGAKIRNLHRHPSVMEEAEDIAKEIEDSIFDSLVSEAVTSLLRSAPQRELRAPS